jgi:hypothetical protein
VLNEQDAYNKKVVFLELAAPAKDTCMTRVILLQKIIMV